ncbi:MAG TPA: cysteine desulfurase family protein [Candidatus Paceibacterota bacterium]|nr:cysteine desulfurase family protein [Candidatus Paceibacterota bacterium]
MTKRIYLDNAAGTPVSAPVRRAMARAVDLTGNPSSVHDDGRRAASALGESRAAVARFLGTRPGDVIFTASASEANTMAIVRLAEANPRYRHIVTNPAEHKSVLDAVALLKRRGWSVTMVPVDDYGFVDPDAVLAAVRKDTLLISVMYANNEIGTIQPVAEIGRKLRRLRGSRPFPLLHTDACQAAGYLPMDVHRLQVDLLTMNGSKIYGPRGIGVLCVPVHVSVEPQVVGSAHERGLRAGTENVPAAVGLAAAVEGIHSRHGERMARVRNRIELGLAHAAGDCRVNGPEDGRRVPGIISLSVAGVRSEELVLELDKNGVSVGAGAACTVRETGHSHVMKAIGVPRRYREGVIRVSLGRGTTADDADRFLHILRKSVGAVRERNRF